MVLEWNVGSCANLGAPERAQCICARAMVPHAPSSDAPALSTLRAGRQHTHRGDRKDHRHVPRFVVRHCIGGERCDGHAMHLRLTPECVSNMRGGQKWTDAGSSTAGQSWQHRKAGGYDKQHERRRARAVGSKGQATCVPGPGRVVAQAAKGVASTVDCRS